MEVVVQVQVVVRWYLLLRSRSYPSCLFFPWGDFHWRWRCGSFARWLSG